MQARHSVRAGGSAISRFGGQGTARPIFPVRFLCHVRIVRGIFAGVNFRLRVVPGATRRNPPRLKPSFPRKIPEQISFSLSQKMVSLFFAALT